MGASGDGDCTIRNEALLRYVERYLSIEEDFLSRIETFGLKFNKNGSGEKDIKSIRDRLRKKGAKYRNNDKSICTGAISSACEACAKGRGCGTITISLMCNRSCYYCFNPNQEEYGHFSGAKSNWRKTLSDWLLQEKEVTHLALSGGEPLLHKEDTLDFFRFIRDHLPDVDTRLYTAGDLLDQQMAEALREAGLQEIRFSVKLEDDDQTKETILERIALAKSYIPRVMVEMPVIPGTGKEMCALLVKLDEIGIHGINLLEFCFPLYNADEFSRRGFLLKYPPFETLYNYWYAGGLAVDGSEALCLELLELALDKNLTMGVHYCSLENKYTGQIYKQNTAISQIPATMLFSDRDYFLKAAKVFGRDIPKVIRLLGDKGVHAYEKNDEYGYLQFHPKHVEYLNGHGIKAAISYNVMEYRENGYFLRELKIEPYNDSL